MGTVDDTTMMIQRMSMANLLHLDVWLRFRLDVLLLLRLNFLG